MEDSNNTQAMSLQFKESLPSLEFVDKLKEDKRLLLQRVRHLEEMLTTTRESLVINVTPEEQICVKQLHTLNLHSNERELTLEEVKKFDFLVKNLKIIRKEANMILDVPAKDMSPDELLAILDETSDQY